MKLWGFESKSSVFMEIGKLSIFQKSNYEKKIFISCTFFCQVSDYCFPITLGVKSSSRLQQMHDMNKECYDKVLEQVRAGEQVCHVVLGDIKGEGGRGVCN